MNLIKELTWRGLVHNIMPGTEELLNTNKIKAYAGFDPTADSLHIGNLVPILLLVHLQKNGHSPIALVGGATGMVGDPSGKSAERNLMSEETLNYNLNCQKKQLEKFLDFNAKENPAEIVNNYDWFKNFGFLQFIRDVGKHITVNYMMSKDSVQKRLEGGMSFTEFSYQLIQGYDFLHLYKEKNVQLQVAGSDQWGNIVTGTELIGRMVDGKGYAFTSPLITKADGTKFGKTETGTVWLDANKTTPYQFYQFWYNTSDVDAEKYIKIFTFLCEETINALIEKHKTEPHLYGLQKTLAAEVTTLVHGPQALALALNTSAILFGNGNIEMLQNLSETEFLQVFEGVQTFSISYENITKTTTYLNLLAETGILPSKNEARKLISANGISINYQKIPNMDFCIAANQLLHGKYILVQKGKKTYYLLEVKK